MKMFNTCFIESVLGFSSICWYGNLYGSTIFIYDYYLFRIWILWLRKLQYRR